MSYMVADLAGTANIGIEGMMLTCALIGVVASAAMGGNAFLGLIVALAVGALLGILMCFIVSKLKTDPTITGIAYNLTAAGGTVFLLFLAVGEKGISSSLASGVLPQVEIPLIKEIPYIGAAVSGHNVLTYVAVLLVFVLLV
jgi:simple sugar transport system permease protein